MNKLTGDEFIQQCLSIKETAVENEYDPKVAALIDLVINNGDVVESLVDDLEEL